MNAASLQDRIINVFVRHLHINPPPPDGDFFDSGTIDSLTFVELIAHLEQEFGIRIPLADLDLDHFRSICHIREFIQTRLSKLEVPIGSYSRIRQ